MLEDSRMYKASLNATKSETVTVAFLFAVSLGAVIAGVTHGLQGHFIRRVSYSDLIIAFGCFAMLRFAVFGRMIRVGAAFCGAGLQFARLPTICTLLSESNGLRRLMVRHSNLSAALCLPSDRPFGSAMHTSGEVPLKRAVPPSLSPSHSDNQILRSPDHQINHSVISPPTKSVIFSMLCSKHQLSSASTNFSVAHGSQ